MTRLLFVRHGQSKANLDGVFAGQIDPALTELGCRQAECTAEFIAENYKVDAVYSSDLQRAYQTGLAVGTPVVAGGGDAQLGTIGVGAVLPGQAATFGGSFWQYEFNTEKPLTDAQGRVRVNCHAIPGQWQFEALIFQPGLVMPITESPVWARAMSLLVMARA